MLTETEEKTMEAGKTLLDAMAEAADPESSYAITIGEHRKDRVLFAVAVSVNGELSERSITETGVELCSSVAHWISASMAHEPTRRRAYAVLRDRITDAFLGAWGHVRYAPAFNGADAGNPLAALFEGLDLSLFDEDEDEESWDSEDGS